MMRQGLHANTDLLRRLLVGFVRDEVRKVGVSKVVLGLSGGIDSALVAFIAAEALGPENVHAICMPYKSSNPESEAHALLVATACGVNFSVVPITAMVDAYFEMFHEADTLRRGNKMARERMTVLFDHSALLRGSGTWHQQQNGAAAGVRHSLWRYGFGPEPDRRHLQKPGLAALRSDGNTD